MKGAGFLDMRGTSAMGMPWRVRRCLFSLGQGIASDVGGGSLQPPCSRSLVDGTPKTGIWSPLLCLKTGATEHINRGHARSAIEFQSNRSIADASQIKIVIVTCCCYQMDLPARSSFTNLAFFLWNLMIFTEQSSERHLSIHEERSGIVLVL